MRAHGIFEKFDEESDPVHDMGIGGVSPRKVHHDILGVAYVEWRDWISQFKGKKVSGKFHKGGWNSPEKNYTFPVKSVRFHFTDDTTNKSIETSSNFAFISEEDNEYFSTGDEKIFIEE